MPGVHTHALSRSLRALTIGAIRSYDDHGRQYQRDALGELDHQFQAPISGEAGGEAAWQEVTLRFAAPLIDGRDERQSDYASPHFTYGSTITKGPPVGVLCNVRRWLVADGIYTGAVVEIGVFRPGAADSKTFAGEVHLNFQGYGLPDDDESDGEDET